MSSLIAYTFDIFMLFETKLGEAFTSAQSSIIWIFVLHRLDPNAKGGGTWLYFLLKSILFVKYWGKVLWIKSKKQKRSY